MVYIIIMTEIAIKTVFISYSHDDETHSRRVLELSNQLINDGLDVILDQYDPHPAEQWPKWMANGLAQADFVLMVCTQTYLKRVMGEEKEGVGKGAKWESSIIYNALHINGVLNKGFIPVVFSESDADHIPMPLKGATYYCLEGQAGYDKMYRHLTSQPKVVKPKRGRIKTMSRQDVGGLFSGDEVKRVKPRIDISRLPSAGKHFFGRNSEVEMLDRCWFEREHCVVSLNRLGRSG